MRRMIIVSAVLVMVLGLAAAAFAKSDIEGKEVEYRDGGVVMKGYIAYDRNMKGRRPGVLIVHEWWGHNEYARRRARMLAELGYVGFAVDMYGEGRQAAHPEDAGKFSSELMKNFDTAKARFLAAMDLLRQQPQTDPGRIAAIGYCFGGGVVLNMARQGADLRGVASFHGGLQAVAPAAPGSIKAKIIVFNGGADKMITPEQVEAFKKEMKEAGAEMTFISYPGVMHSFTNPDADEYAKKFNLPLAYNADADRKSWQRLKDFLKTVFRQKRMGGPASAGPHPYEP